MIEGVSKKGPPGKFARQALCWGGIVNALLLLAAGLEELPDVAFVLIAFCFSGDHMTPFLAISGSHQPCQVVYIFMVQYT